MSEEKKGKRKLKQEVLDVKHLCIHSAPTDIGTGNLLLEPSLLISLSPAPIFLGSMFAQNQALPSISTPLPNAKALYRVLMRDAL